MQSAVDTAMLCVALLLVLYICEAFVSLSVSGWDICQSVDAWGIGVHVCFLLQQICVKLIAIYVRILFSLPRLQDNLVMAIITHSNAPFFFYTAH